MAKVHIEFQRVQTWLFSVPRLRAMVGANTLLGEVLREKLPALARSGSAWSLRPLDGQFPSPHPRDPLGDADDPAADAAVGILSRDGGHFEARFSSGAKAFADAAASLIRTELPGLRFAVTVDDEVLKQGTAVLSTELPVLAPCNWTGGNLASFPVSQGEERENVSREVRDRHDAAPRAGTDSAADLASLLARETELAGRKHPETFEALASGEYLAVIHADGNGVGVARPERDHESADFFHRNRVLLRRALKTAIDGRCNETPGGVAPLLVLMLGGDDVLVVCRASVALPFVVDLCRELERLQADRGDAFHLTLGVGVVISRESVPFHRLHAIAERLASSAKRKFRGLVASEQASVVDWAVYTTAWADDPAEARARDWIRGTGENRRLLSRRPLIVTGEGHDRLDGLLASASKLEKAPRSQLQHLVAQLGQGRTLAELAFEELSAPAAGDLHKAGVTEVWSRPEDSGEVQLTSLLDLVEVFEIPKLGRARTPAVPAEVAAERGGGVE